VIRGRYLVWPVLAALLVALGLQTGRLRDRLRGELLLRQVELVLIAAAQSGQAPNQLLPENLARLRAAARFSPTEVGVPIARGSQYLLFGRVGSAIESYHEAAALEPRPEIYLNLGRAQWSAGQREEAKKSFQLAVRLDPHLAGMVPPGAQ
jgi:tetratricopeptide (TPR) repeat protein